MDNHTFKRTSWAEQARASWESRAAFERKAGCAPFDRLFFGVRSSGEGIIGLYSEWYFDQGSAEISACMLAYAAPENDVLNEISADVLTLHLGSGLDQRFELASPGFMGKAYRFRLEIQLQKIDTSTMEVGSVRARLEKNYGDTYAIRNLKILPTKWPSREHNLQVFGKLSDTEQSFCPNCFGRGSFKTMAIPRADRESGATGYGLFSCNKLNGREACGVCGGAGGEFLPWYVEEHPELRGISYVPGSGLQLCPV